MSVKNQDMILTGLILPALAFDLIIKKNTQ